MKEGWTKIQLFFHPSIFILALRSSLIYHLFDSTMRADEGAA